MQFSYLLLLVCFSVGVVQTWSWSGFSSLLGSNDGSSIPPVDKLNGTCGKNRLKGGTIVGGVVAGEGEFPWIVSFQYKQRGDKMKHFCGGVIISEHWVLSAAHCFYKLVDNKAMERVRIMAGTNNIFDNTGDVYEIEKTIVHSGFEDKSFHDDIALLRTKKPINFRKSESNYKVNSVCLPPYKTDKVAYPPETAVVSGWGATKSGLEDTPEKLLKVTVALINHDECLKTYSDVHKLTMSQKTVCYGKDNKDSCQGDSGGPLVKFVNGRIYTIGIVSFGAGCGTFPGVYTSVVQYRDWIASNIF